MTFLILLAGAVLVGIYAQLGKGRTGAAWAFLTLIFGGVVWLFIRVAPDHGPRIAEDTYHIAMAVMAAGIEVVVMGLITATLPRRRSTTSS